MASHVLDGKMPNRRATCLLGKKKAKGIRRDNRRETSGFVPKYGENKFAHVGNVKQKPPGGYLMHGNMPSLMMIFKDGQYQNQLKQLL